LSATFIYNRRNQDKSSSISEKIYSIFPKNIGSHLGWRRTESQIN
jgi:hypothetical protein